MISFNLILPELNEFIADLGGANKKGLIITLFTISAALSRPFSGKLSDTIGRKKVMLIGVVFAVIITLIYPLSSIVSIFLLLRFMHGFSAGFLPTAATAMVTDILPKNKRGVGMGIWGVFISIGIGAGQFLGSIVRTEFNMTYLFIISALFSVLCGFMILMIKETLPEPENFKWSLLKITWVDVFEPNVMPAAIVMFFMATSSGIVFVITQDISVFLDIENKGWFFGFYMLSTIIVRIFTASLSDKIGRRKTLIIGLFIMAISMAMVILTREWIMYTAASIVFGMATGISSPTLFAWTADLSHHKRRGIGASTLFIALELGIMFGATSTLLTYNNKIDSLPYVFGVGVLFALFATAYLFWHLRNRESQT